MNEDGKRYPCPFHHCLMINEKCEECNELFEYVERLLRLEPFASESCQHCQTEGFSPFLWVLVFSLLIVSPSAATCFSLMLENKAWDCYTRFFWLAMQEKYMVLMSVPLCIWVGLVMLSMSITLERMTLLSNSCSQPLVLKQHLLGEGNSSSCHHDNRNELQLFTHLVRDSFFLNAFNKPGLNYTQFSPNGHPLWGHLLPTLSPCSCWLH